jgi:hypothetical protein
MSRLPTRADTRIELISPALFSWDARDRSLRARTGHLLTHTRASNSLITTTGGETVEVVHSAPAWSLSGGAIGLRVDPAEGSDLLPGSDPVADRLGDSLTGTISPRLPVDGSGLVRFHRAGWMDEAGTLDAAVLLGVGGTNPRLVLHALAASRTLRISLYDSLANEVGAQIALPAGSVLAVAFQWQALDSAGAVRLDVGAGYGSWSSALGGAIAGLGDGVLSLGDAADTAGSQAATALCQVHLAGGHLTRDQLLEAV